jgi:hypothetical protein
MFGVRCHDYDCAVLHVVFIRQRVTSYTAVKGGFVNSVTQTHCILPCIGTYWADWAVRCWWAYSKLFISLWKCRVVNVATGISNIGRWGGGAVRQLSATT